MATQWGTRYLSPRLNWNLAVKPLPSIVGILDGIVGLVDGDGDDLASQLLRCDVLAHELIGSRAS